MGQNFLLVSEAAKLLSVSPQTLRNWARSGHITALRHPLNGYRVFAYEDVMKLAAELPRTGHAEAAAGINWDFPESSQEDSIHGFHSYPAKFIPEIPRSLIELFPPPPGTCVFDPFCGCGTTLVEAQRKQHPSFGTDLNPIACLLSEVKTRNLPCNFTHEYQRVLFDAPNLLTDEDSIQEIPNVGHWFRPEVSAAIDKLRRAILSTPATTRPFLDAALSAIIVKVSNQESDTRYAAVSKDVSAKAVYASFEISCNKMLTLWKQRGQVTAEAKVFQTDVRDLKAQQFSLPVGLTITSPPYPNAYEYWLYHKYRMYWLRHDPIRVREREIGARAHYFKKNHPTDADFARVLQHVFTVTFARSVKGAFACVVIGRSIIHGRRVDNAAITTEAALAAGFKLITKLGRTMNKNRKSFNLSHARISEEDVLIFQKP